jgi:hypothetical protein
LTGEDLLDADARTDLALSGSALNPQLPSATITLTPNILPSQPIHIPVQKLEAFVRVNAHQSLQCLVVMWGVGWVPNFKGSHTMPREETRSDRSTSPTGSEFFNALQEMSRDWMGRATAEVELGLKLSKKLTTAHSVPDAVAAYQEWLNEELSARAEDARLLMSNGQKFMDTTSRFLSSGWTNAGMTT